MAKISCFEDTDCRRAAQYLVTIVAVLLVGYLLSILPVMIRLEFAGGLLAADLILFVSRLTALGLFFLFARHAMAAIRDEGGTLSFIRGIVEPTAVLVIVVIGQGLLWQVIDPFVGVNGKTVYFGVVITLIVMAGIWLVFRAYQQAPELVDAAQYLTAHFPKLMPEQRNRCSACGEKLSLGAKFCSHCGHKIEEALKCLNCGEKLVPGQKYCQHCGKAVVATIPTDSER